MSELDITELVCNVLEEIGYIEYSDSLQFLFYWRSVPGNCSGADFDVAGDQGIMVGYATDEHLRIRYENGKLFFLWSLYSKTYYQICCNSYMWVMPVSVFPN